MQQIFAVFVLEYQWSPPLFFFGACLEEDQFLLNYIIVLIVLTLRLIIAHHFENSRSGEMFGLFQSQNSCVVFLRLACMLQKVVLKYDGHGWRWWNLNIRKETFIILV